METKTKALLIGASGLTGSSCLRFLLDDGFYNEVEIWLRRPTGISHPKLTEKIIDFNTIETACDTDALHVFCCLGTTINKAKTRENFYKTDHDYVIEAAKVAKRGGAEKFLYISSIGANAVSKNFYLRTKGQVEEDLKKNFEDGLFLLRPSMLMGKRSEFRFGELAGKVIMGILGIFMVGKLKKYKGIPAETVAKAMIVLAKQPAKGISIIESDKIFELVNNNIKNPVS